MLKELECSKQEVEHLQEVEGELRIESDEFTKQLNNLQVNFDQKQVSYHKTGYKFVLSIKAS